MKLPFSFGFKKKEEKNHFLALLLQDEKVGAVVLEEANGTIHVIGHAEERFATSLEEASFDEWLEIVDRAVSTAEENLPGKIQTEKTVFGVKQDWIIEGKIKRSYLTRLKKICEELALQPIGFLVFTEAILHLLQKEEGAPVSSILVELGKKFIIISVVRAGRIVETKLIPFEKPVSQAVDTALKEFSVEILPSRIILFNSEDNKPLTQEFISHSWSKSLPFLHMPQVTVLPATFDTKSVLYGTAAQLGFAVVGADTLPTKTHSMKETKTPLLSTEELTQQEEETNEPSQDENSQEESLGEETPPTEENETVLPDAVGADYFGFLQNADVATSTPSKKHKNIENNEDKKDGENDDDIGGSKAKEEQFLEETEELPEEVKGEETEEFSASNLSASASLLFSSVKSGIQKLLKQKSLARIVKQVTPLLSTVSARIPSLIKKSSKHKTAERFQDEGGSTFPLPIPIIAGAGAVVIIIAIILFYMFGISAKVVLTASPKVLSNDQQVTFVTDGSSDYANGVLSAQTVSADEKGSLSQQTTGTKQVGTSAKGTVTIVNVSDTASLSAGTTLTTSDGKKFTLDKATNVPAGDVITPGTTTAPVTAANIGPEYNMPSGTKFTIGNSATIGAKNDNAFSGGTKKDVIVVAQADVDKLSSDLIKNLEDKARTDLGQQASGSKMLLPFFTKEDLSQQTFSKKVGDEAQNLSLDATVTYQGIVVDKTDMANFASHVMQGDIPSDMILTADGIHTDLSDVKQTKDTVAGTLSMKASLMPKVDTAQLSQTLAGKSFQQATDLVKSIPQIQNVDFILSPNLPFLPRILPRLSSHITVTLSAQ